MMKLAKTKFSILALIAGNLVPVAGILFLGWDAAALLLLYWAENIVIGFYTALKMACLKVERGQDLAKLFFVPFFMLHFGGFCALHGLFIMAFLKIGGGPGSFFTGSALNWPGPLVFIQLLVGVIAHLMDNLPQGLEWPLVGLLASHGVSFFQNFILGGEYASMNIQQVMMQPYKRIVLLHVTIIAGGLPVMMLGSPAWMLFAMVALKIGMDIHLHVKSHGKVITSQNKEATA